jgi:membrane dipeptidase
MKYLLICLSLFQFAFAQSYKKLHNNAVVADTHNDIISTCIDKGFSFDQQLAGKTHSDLQRMKEGGVDVQVFSIWCDGKQEQPFALANRQIDTLYAWTNRNSGAMMITKTPEDVKNALKQHKLACMIGVEGGHMMENDLAKLDSLHKRGTSYMTLTWNNSNPWATSAMEETTDSLLHQPKGLSEFGKAVVKRMNELGMMIDLSHVGEQTFKDAIATTTKPVLISHSCVYNLCPVFRNLKDDQIKAVAKNGGVIQLNFFSLFLDSNFQKKYDSIMAPFKVEIDSVQKADPKGFDDYMNKKYAAELEQIKAPFSLLFDHLDYIVKLVGVDYVGLGSDFDGISMPPQGLYDVTTYPLITKELLARGYSKKDIKKILGGNFLRVFKANAVEL